jgi:hypothetical protein
MARKAGDLMSLLAQRGGARRSRSGFLSDVLGTFGRWFRRSDAHAPRRRGTPGTAFAVVGLFALGVGYLAGNAFPWRAAAADMRMNGGSGRRGVAPGPVDEEQPLAKTALLAAAYRDRSAALAAAHSLQAAPGLDKARIREMPKDQYGPIWALLVYFEGSPARDATAKAMKDVKAPDEAFEEYRKITKDWPGELVVR